MATVLGWNNLVKSAAIISANSVALDPSNVANDIGSPSVAWQSRDGAVTLATGGLLRIDFLARSTVRAVGLFRTNLTNAASVNITTWINPSSPSATYTVTMSGPAAGYGQIVAVFPSDVQADFVQITFDDAANPDNHLNVPLVFAGPVWFPATALSYSSALGRDNSAVKTTSRGGQTYIDPLWQGRRWEIALDGVRADEVFDQVDDLHMTANLGSNVLLIPDTGSANLQREALFGTLEATADITFPYGAADRRRWTARITERL